jgi:hypothetical protein
MSETSLSYGGGHEQQQQHLYASLPFSPLMSTAWVPLEGLCTQWGTRGQEAHETSILQVVGLAFTALSYERRAHIFYQQAHLRETGIAPTPMLDQVLSALLQARECWSDALLVLEQHTSLELDPTQRRQVARLLLAEVRTERLRLTTLLAEVEREQVRGSGALRTAEGEAGKED